MSMEFVVSEWLPNGPNKHEENLGSELRYFSIIRDRGRNYSKSENQFIEEICIDHEVRYQSYWCPLFFRFKFETYKDENGKYKKSDKDFSLITSSNQKQAGQEFDDIIVDSVSHIVKSTEYRSSPTDWISTRDSYWNPEGETQDLIYEPYKVIHRHTSYVKDNRVCCDTEVRLSINQFNIQTHVHSILIEDTNESDREGFWESYCFVSVKNTKTGEMKTSCLIEKTAVIATNDKF